VASCNQLMCLTFVRSRLFTPSSSPQSLHLSRYSLTLHLVCTNTFALQGKSIQSQNFLVIQFDHHPLDNPNVDLKLRLDMKSLDIYFNMSCVSKLCTWKCLFALGVLQLTYE